MKLTSLALSLGAVAASSEVSMMKSPEGLRKLGLERILQPCLDSGSIAAQRRQGRARLAHSP